jgi:hypothetical protein
MKTVPAIKLGIELKEQAETASKAGMIGTVGQVGGIALTAVFA